MGVFNFYFSTSAEGRSKNQISDSDSEGEKTFGTIDKSQKLDYDKLSLISIINYYLSILSNYYGHFRTHKVGKPPRRYKKVENSTITN